ncbi:carboxypeptidase-like regulatory domain-containing protein [Ekhidna sp.]|uniref:carboxypeptidase-like regulatory domain-containing protein n=1 Tax=Ekhidna sp. TaxID=2608089 RepID=UPI00329709C2
MKKHSILVLTGLSLIFLLSTASAPIQVLKTKLHVTVVDDLGNPVEGASITIFSSAKDYENNSNKLIEGKSNKKGIYKFKGLETKPYFLDVRKDKLKNDGEGVQTGSLAKGKINKVIVVLR